MSASSRWVSSQLRTSASSNRLPEMSSLNVATAVRRTVCKTGDRKGIRKEALQRKSHLCILFLGIARPQSQFPHSCVCERFIYSKDRPTYFLQQNRQIAHRHKCGNGTMAVQFLFWEYYSVHCTYCTYCTYCFFVFSCQLQYISGVFSLLLHSFHRCLLPVASLIRCIPPSPLCCTLSP
jgi:hypothetical protein